MPKMQLYYPHKNQEIIHRCRAKYRVAVCGRRFGKTAGVLNEALAQAFQMKNQIIWIILPLLKQAKEIYWIDPDVTRYYLPYVSAGLIKIDNSELSLHIKETNSWIRLKGSDNYEGLRGSGIDLIIYDEAADIKPLAYETIKPSLADSPLHKIIYVGTPKGLNQFHELALKGDKDHIIPTFGKVVDFDPDWQTFHFTSYDNMTWADGTFERTMFVNFIDKERQDHIKKGKLAFFNQEYLGQFSQSAGQVFPEFSITRHVGNPFIPPKKSMIFGGLDWGRVHAFCILLSSIEKVLFKDTYFYRIRTFYELFGHEKTPREWGTLFKQDMKDKGIQLKDVSWISADTQLFNVLADKSVSLADQFSLYVDSEYKRILKPASKARVAGWESMHNWLSDAPDGEPYWIISRDCPHLTSQIPGAVYDEIDQEDVKKIDDDAIDTARYMVKSIKWISGQLGAIKHPEAPKYPMTAQVDRDQNQISVNLDKFSDPKLYKNYRTQ